MAEETELEKCYFRNFRDTVTLTLNRVIRHTVMHQSSTSMYIRNFIEIGQTCCGRTDGHTYWRMDISPSNVIRSSRRSRPNGTAAAARRSAGYSDWTGGAAVCSDRSSGSFRIRGHSELAAQLGRKNQCVTAMTLLKNTFTKVEMELHQDLLH